MRKRDYPNKLRTQLREWQDRVERLRRDLRRAGEDSRRELEHQIEDLQAKQKAARRKLEQLESFCGEARLDPGKRIKRAGRRINHRVRKLISGFR